MTIDTQEKAVEAIVRAIPHPEQIKNWQFIKNSKSVDFEWRGHRFRFGYDYMTVCEVNGGLLSTSNISILLRELIKVVAYK